MEKTFYSQGRPQEQFFAEINQWFSVNRNILIRNLYTAENTQIGFLVNKSALSNITLIYDVNNACNTVYGISYHEKFSLVKIGPEKLCEEWQMANPHLDVVKYSYIHNARGQTGSLIFNGLGANNRNQVWIIYKMKEKRPVAPTAQGTVQTAKFCSACGKPLTPGAKFCPYCGNKIG